MNIIVTGSNGLIGKGLCDYLETKGYLVKGVDLIDGVDLSDEKSNDEFFRRNSKYDRLINLFAINDHVEKKQKTKQDNLLDYELDRLREYCDVNIIALFNTCRNFIRYSKSPKSIINISSLYGVRSPKHFIYDKPKDIGYTITKHAVVGVTKHMATYFAEMNIRTNCVVPGGIINNQPQDFINRYSINTPMKRMMNKQELYPLLEFLSSDDASYITGSIINVDGGWCAW